MTSSAICRSSVKRPAVIRHTVVRDATPQYRRQPPALRRDWVLTASTQFCADLSELASLAVERSSAFASCAGSSVSCIWVSAAGASTLEDRNPWTPSRPFHVLSGASVVVSPNNHVRRD